MGTDMPSNEFHNKVENVVIWSTVVFLIVLLGYYKISAYGGTQRVELKLNIPESIPRQNIWNIPVTEADITCMALNIYFEARSESIEAQYAVADVVMYRTMHYNFPSTPCDVINDGIYSKWNPTMPRKWKCSFMWVCDRLPDIPKNAEAYKVAEYIAKDVLTNPDYWPEIEYALYYHADYVHPRWAPTKRFVGRRGTHIFYDNPVK